MNKTTLSLAMAVAGASVLAGCATHHAAATSGAMGAGPATTAVVTTTTAPMPAATQLSAADVKAIATAAGAGMYEVDAGRLAATRAASPQVRAYARMLVEQHTANNAELMALVQRKGQRIAPGLPAELQAKVTQLSALQGAAFDRQFVMMTGVQDHMAAINAMEQARRTVADRDLQAFIDKTLPVLRSHLQQAQTLAGTMAG